MQGDVVFKAFQEQRIGTDFGIEIVGIGGIVGKGEFFVFGIGFDHVDGKDPGFVSVGKTSQKRVGGLLCILFHRETLVGKKEGQLGGRPK